MIPNNPTFVRPDVDHDYPTRRNKYILIGIWIGFAVMWIPPSILLNLYTFAGIDFPNERVFGVWVIGGPILLYGSALAVPIIALSGVRKGHMGYPLLVALLAIPFAIQVAALAGYFILTDIYGAVCC